MKKPKLLSRFFVSIICLISFMIDISNATELNAPGSKFFMTYKLNGKSYTLNQAALKLVSNDIRYSISGASNIQGNINTITIRYNGGPPSKGTYSTNTKKLVFMLGTNDGESTTFDLLNASFGNGTFTIAELTDKYIEGSFSFVTYLGDYEGSRKKIDVTDGLFKGQILKY